MLQSVFNPRFLAVVGLLAGTLAVGYAASEREPEQLSAPLETIPRQVGAWESTDLGKLDEAIENVLLADDYLNREYRKGRDWARVFMAFYGMQKSGEAMHSPKNCLPGAGWEIWKYGTVDVPVDGENVAINKYYVQKGQSRMLVYYWYQNADRVVASEYYAKICLVWDAVMKGRTSGSIVRITLPDDKGSELAGEELAARLIPLVRDVLPKSEDL